MRNLLAEPTQCLLVQPGFSGHSFWNYSEALLLYRMRPNDDENHVNSRQNRALAVQMATQAAKQIPVPENQ